MKNDDEYEVGDWILVEHGRWTRGLKVEMAQEGKITVRAVEAQYRFRSIKNQTRYPTYQKNRFRKTLRAEGK